MAKAKITYTCKLCGRLFVPPRTGRVASYCSQPCYHADKQPAIARFWDRIDKSPGHGPQGACWLWIGKSTTKGYGKLGNSAAHRVSWELTNGPIPNGLWVLHRCDTPLCCNPAHLFLGTNADNSADMVAKDRSPWGSRHPNAVLTEDIVRQARALYVPRKFSYRKVAALLGFPEPGIRAAILRVTWTHLE